MYIIFHSIRNHINLKKYFLRINLNLITYHVKNIFSYRKKSFYTHQTVHLKPTTLFIKPIAEDIHLLDRCYNIFFYPFF